MGLRERKAMNQRLKVRADGIEWWKVKRGGVGDRDTCHSIASFSPQHRPWLGAPLQVGLVGFW